MLEWKLAKLVMARFMIRIFIPEWDVHLTKQVERKVMRFLINIPSFMIPKMIPDIAPGMISIKYGFRGPNYATVSACASSTNSILAAMDAIRMGRAKMVVTGGSEAVTSMTGIGGFNAMKALSTRNDDYKTASRPFDKDRDGFVLGEGAACLILEDYEHHDIIYKVK